MVATPCFFAHRSAKDPGRIQGTQRQVLRTGQAADGRLELRQSTGKDRDTCAPVRHIEGMHADPLDRALDQLHATDFEYASENLDGLSNHGPMAAEALVALGRPERVEPFVAAYMPRLRPLRPAARALAERYERAVGEGDWRAPLREALDELLPGAVAAGAHGWIRTGHAVRALATRDTPARRRELAFALASWSARAERLPGQPGARPEPGLDVVRALARVPIVAPVDRKRGGLITEQAEVVQGFTGFADAVEAVDLAAQPFSEAVSALAAAAARLYLATPAERFVYLHAVTATSALRIVGDALDEERKRRALGAVFQVVAALHATHADPGTAPRGLEEPFAPDLDLRQLERSPATLAARAAESDDDHDVKLTEAALREHARSPRDEFVAAAAVRLGLFA